MFGSTPGLRVRPALAAVVIELAVGYALLVGLSRHSAAPPVRPEVTRLAVQPLPPSPSPPPPPPSPRPTANSPADRQGTAGLKAEATQIVAPRPPVVFASPPPVVVAPSAGAGARATAGAASAGSGPGAGGEGAGAGAGGDGGSGHGGAGGGSGAQRVAGGLRDSDYPAEAARARAAGTVVIRFHVGVDGRVRACEVTRSSGHAALDRTTCRLVEKRFRYRPASDAGGRPVDSVETTEFTWGPRLP